MPPARIPDPDVLWMRRALVLARRGHGKTSPNPSVGAVIVRGGEFLGGGWHHCAGGPHAEIEAFRDVERRGGDPRGAALYVTLEPCCTHGRTPPCTDAILGSGVRRVVVAAIDPNPRHAGRGIGILREAGIEVTTGVCESVAMELNESFNHWILGRTPFVTLKAAMTLDGKIATVSGESKWITGDKSRAVGMRLRRGSDAILVGVNTVLVDDPALIVRDAHGRELKSRLRRIVLDSAARTPLESRVVSDDHRVRTTIVVAESAPVRRVEELARRVRVLRAPADARGRVDLRWLMTQLGSEDVTRLLVEGGGEVNGGFLDARLAHRIAFFYAPKIIGGESAPRGVGGIGAVSEGTLAGLRDIRWRRLGADLFLTARLKD